MSPISAATRAWTFASPTTFGEEVAEESVLAPDQDHHQDRGAHQQDGLDDLHPGGGDHAAEQHVGQHQHAHGDHRHLVVDADQCLDQHAGPDHLRGQVEGGHGDRRDRADDACLLRVVAIGEDVRQRVLADIPARLGDHQQHGDVGDQPAHRVHEAVVTVERDQAGDAEERRRRQVVTRNRPAILQAGNAAAGRVEVRGCLDALGRHVGDVHRHGDDGAEDEEGQPFPVVGDGTLCQRRHCDQRQRQRACRNE